MYFINCKGRFIFDEIRLSIDQWQKSVDKWIFNLVCFIKKQTKTVVN
ncbi:hypothetical protein DK095_490062 [Flavobacterium psychrophilum]|nr:hypothetical protein DK095_490062 [Flavobacterium psychrophilum]